MKTNRRSFLKLLSVSPAIFQALPAKSAGLGWPKDPPKPVPQQPQKPTPSPTPRPTPQPTKVGTGSVIISYPGKPTGTGGVAKYNPETNMTTHTFYESGKFYG
jgi:hypothetical protein